MDSCHPASRPPLGLWLCSSCLYQGILPRADLSASPDPVLGGHVHSWLPGCKGCPKASKGYEAGSLLQQLMYLRCELVTQRLPFWDGYNNPQVSGENLIGLSRARRPHNAIFVNFDDEEIPTKALDAAVQTWKKVCTNPVDKKAEEELRKLFEVRPVWSRNAVKANISVHPDKLKLLLPYLAYYMLTGPWRSLWVRFGYDPRKHPEAKIYQVLDFRIRCGMKYGYAPNDMPVKAKRSTYNYSLPITVKKPVSHTVSVHDLKQGLGTSGASGAKKPASSRYKLKESIYVFREGALPPYRQMFYQLCDLNVESLQKIIHRNDGTESECTERDGWCLPKTSDDLRDSMSLMIKQIIRSTRPALFSNTTNSEDGKEQLAYESGEDEDDEEEEEEEFKPSDGSENEMETEILDYV